MSYYISKKLKITFDEAIDKVTLALKAEGFGVVTDFNVTNAFKNKLGIDFKPYRILGACNPPYAKKALDLEDKIGVMLPCNVVVQINGDEVEITAIDPVVSMVAINNPEIEEIAKEIGNKLKSAINSL